jgi:hypothetical protein
MVTLSDHVLPLFFFARPLESLRGAVRRPRGFGHHDSAISLLRKVVTSYFISSLESVKEMRRGKENAIFLMMAVITALSESRWVSTKALIS